MSKILLFLGSPRKNGISHALAEQVVAGAKSAGAEIVTYNLNDEAIKGCQAVITAAPMTAVLQKTVWLLFMSILMK